MPRICMHQRKCGASFALCVLLLLPLHYAVAFDDANSGAASKQQLVRASSIDNREASDAHVLTLIDDGLAVGGLTLFLRTLLWAVGRGDAKSWPCRTMYLSAHDRDHEKSVEPLCPVHATIADLFRGQLRSELQHGDEAGRIERLLHTYFGSNLGEMRDDPNGHRSYNRLFNEFVDEANSGVLKDADKITLDKLPSFAGVEKAVQWRMYTAAIAVDKWRNRAQRLWTPAYDFDKNQQPPMNEKYENYLSWFRHVLTPTVEWEWPSRRRHRPTRDHEPTSASTPLHLISQRFIIDAKARTILQAAAGKQSASDVYQALTHVLAQCMHLFRYVEALLRMWWSSNEAVLELAPEHMIDGPLPQKALQALLDAIETLAILVQTFVECAKQHANKSELQNPVLDEAKKIYATAYTFGCSPFDKRLDRNSPASAKSAIFTCRKGPTSGGNAQDHHNLCPRSHNIRYVCSLTVVNALCCDISAHVHDLKKQVEEQNALRKPSPSTSPTRLLGVRRKHSSSRSPPRSPASAGHDDGVLDGPHAELERVAEKGVLIGSRTTQSEIDTLKTALVGQFLLATPKHSALQRIPSDRSIFALTKSSSEQQNDATGWNFVNREWTNLEQRMSSGGFDGRAIVAQPREPFLGVGIQSPVFILVRAIEHYLRGAMDTDTPKTMLNIVLRLLFPNTNLLLAHGELLEHFIHEILYEERVHSSKHKVGGPNPIGFEQNAASALNRMISDPAAHLDPLTEVDLSILLRFVGTFQRDLLATLKTFEAAVKLEIQRLTMEIAQAKQKPAAAILPFPAPKAVAIIQIRKRPTHIEHQPAPKKNDFMRQLSELAPGLLLQLAASPSPQIHGSHTSIHQHDPDDAGRVAHSATNEQHQMTSEQHAIGAEPTSSAHTRTPHFDGDNISLQHTADVVAGGISPRLHSPTSPTHHRRHHHQQHSNARQHSPPPLHTHVHQSSAAAHDGLFRSDTHSERRRRRRSPATTTTTNKTPGDGIVDALFGDETSAISSSTSDAALHPTHRSPLSSSTNSYGSTASDTSSSQQHSSSHSEKMHRQHKHGPEIDFVLEEQRNNALQDHLSFYADLLLVASCLRHAYLQHPHNHHAPSNDDAPLFTRISSGTKELNKFILEKQRLISVAALSTLRALKQRHHLLAKSLAHMHTALEAQLLLVVNFFDFFVAYNYRLQDVVRTQPSIEMRLIGEATGAILNFLKTWPSRVEPRTDLPSTNTMLKPLNLFDEAIGSLLETSFRLGLLDGHTGGGGAGRQMNAEHQSMQAFVEHLNQHEIFHELMEHPTRALNFAITANNIISRFVKLYEEAKLRENSSNSAAYTPELGLFTSKLDMLFGIISSFYAELVYGHYKESA